MSTTVKTYTEAVYDNLNPLYANWEPGAPVSLGDFGELRDRTFVRLGNIAEFGMTFDPIDDDTPDHKFFTSEDSVEVKFNARGNVPIDGVANAKATLEVAFANKDAVFFNAADCIHSMIASKVKLGKDVMAAYDDGNGDWQREWVVVTDLVTAGATTIAVSLGNSASIVFEAEANVEKINLADANLGLSIKSSSNVGLQVVADHGLVLLLGLCKIQTTFLWWSDKFKPLARGLNDARMLNVYENSSRIVTEESSEALYFGQLK